MSLKFSNHRMTHELCQLDLRQLLVYLMHQYHLQPFPVCRLVVLNQSPMVDLKILHSHLHRQVVLNVIVFHIYVTSVNILLEEEGGAAAVSSSLSPDGGPGGLPAESPPGGSKKTIFTHELIN
jgi:hypothetical protein